MVHSFSGDNQMYLAEDFLVVEVALYPPKNTDLKVAASDFSLILNGKKPALQPVTPQFAAMSLNSPAWRSGPNLDAGGGMGNVGVILGGPNRTPGPGGQPNPGPRVPKAPDPNDRSGLEKREPVSAPELLVRTALPEGTVRGPVSGFLYFAWKGKIKSIKTLELRYDDAVVKLR